MRSLAAGLGLAFALTLAAPGAQAETCIPGTNICQGGDIRHASPDKGYDPPIIVFCDFGAPWSQRKLIPEGMSSTTRCGNDTDQVFVRAGEEIRCWTPRPKPLRGTWAVTFDAPGRHKIVDNWSKRCQLWKD